MDEIQAYILRFLLGDSVPEDACRAVGYTADEQAFHTFRLVILPSGFFGEDVYGTARSMPTLPLPMLKGGTGEAVDGDLPILFGRPEITRRGHTIVLHADVIAGAYFLLSRYEEWMRPDVRDIHGRFPGRESIAHRAGFLRRPLVDDYGRLLRRLLREVGCVAPEPHAAFSQINLTHDVDAPFFCRTPRSMARELLRGNLMGVFRGYFGRLEDDPYYTFPWMLQQDDRMRTIFGADHCRPILFFRAGGNDVEDRPHYDLHGRDIGCLLKLCRDYDVEIGLHASHEAGRRPELIAREKAALENAIDRPVTLNRHHFLGLREPQHMEALENAGITDDYTMGYADQVGFRLGTARPVRCIYPATRHLSRRLILHPLTVMECTLSAERYMHLDERDALRLILELADETRRSHGSLTLLWHNTSATPRAGYLKNLYSRTLVLLANGVHGSQRG